MEAGTAGSVTTGAKEDKSSTGHVWTAGFHHVTVRVLKLTNRLFLESSNFFGPREPRILNQSVRGHDCTSNLDCGWNLILGVIQGNKVITVTMSLGSGAQFVFPYAQYDTIRFTMFCTWLLSLKKNKSWRNRYNIA
jgi:hypothetical protein